MVVLSYDSVKHTIIMMSLYLVCISLIIKGLGYFMEYNFTSGFQSLLNGTDFNLEVPKFNLDSFSFELISTTIKAKVQAIIQILIPVSTAVIPSSTLIGSAQTSQAFSTVASKVVAKA